MNKTKKPNKILIIALLVAVVLIVKNIPSGESQGYVKVYDKDGNVIMNEQLFQSQSMQQSVVYSGPSEVKLTARNKLPVTSDRVEFGFNIVNTGNAPLLLHVSDAQLLGYSKAHIDYVVHAHSATFNGSTYDYVIPVGSSEIHKVYLTIGDVDTSVINKLVFNIQAEGAPSVPVYFEFIKDSIINVVDIDNFDQTWTGYTNININSEETILGISNILNYNTPHYTSFISKSINMGDKSINDEDSLCVVAKTNSLNFGSVNFELGSTTRTDQYEKEAVFTPSYFGAANQWVVLKSPAFKDMPNQGVGSLDLNNIVRTRIITYSPNNVVLSFDKMFICREGKSYIFPATSLEVSGFVTNNAAAAVDGDINTYERFGAWDVPEGTIIAGYQLSDEVLVGEKELMFKIEPLRSGQGIFEVSVLNTRYNGWDTLKSIDYFNQGQQYVNVLVEDLNNVDRLDPNNVLKIKVRGGMKDTSMYYYDVALVDKSVIHS